MKVIYTDPDGRADTYHPKLGKLISGEPFDLPDETAAGYVDSGLLKQVKVKTGWKPKPGNIKMKLPAASGRGIKTE